ncbi:RdgB/HAM1 family non-canonical purine NTP pyrophosphatase [Corynebacterium spheniscorum]|uniref:dITP/XTP pyrophosphatase n=1 Tax=Corynebacterium spheniscorum TaxID=185761 RepID=A0A1I2QDD4_9CORY|nr:RdgB/HAM1 family non-canonical purine NTP pyrophosphatase [Corynebacterium spheniscorum]KAA8719643.1 RdgB/HAM1 family non-canonical purine NTP pyrophosphatase [Corynebacterium spheniscorum]SFG25653.1 XTP/dITP diphosphohydrolase [Corynebacterium spheniscorum]
MKLLVASNNPKKLKELQTILDKAEVTDVELVSLKDVEPYPEPVEDGLSFEENALLKAREGAVRTGLATISDDSGLAVEAMNGCPGIFSARWAGGHGDDEANNQLLLAQLADVRDEARKAAFVSVCALVSPDGQAVVSEGRWEGFLLREPRGENGFGYDPLFLPAEEYRGSLDEGRSSAQLSAEEKNALSHRGRALAGLVDPIRVLSQGMPGQPYTGQ